MRKKIIILAVAAALVCVFGCSPQQKVADSADTVESTESDSQAVAWSMESECSVCHTVEQETLSDNSCTASLHATVSCATCHSDEEGLGRVHEGAVSSDKIPTKLRKTAVDNDACLSCHNAEELKAATADLTILTDENGTTKNPHDLPETEGHESITCGGCHKMHESASDPLVTAPEFCIGCHHENVYECGTCH